jgi:DNA-binding winged helix-turn-helix (wHTH) protein
MLKSVRYRLGHWTFIPSAHELRSGEARVRLEQRASATLSLLCERTGEVVSRDDIIERAWRRRHLSANSVAVVISDLRRALDIAAGEPGSIETVPKAGYRLIAGPREAVAAPRRMSALGLVAAAMLAVVLIAAAAIAWRAQASKPEVAMAGIVNATGTARYAALMRACNATVLVDLAKHSSTFVVSEGTGNNGERADNRMQQRWVLWSGQPELVLVASDAHGYTVWSGAVFGDESSFPAKIDRKVQEFSASLARASQERQA